MPSKSLKTSASNFSSSKYGKFASNTSKLTTKKQRKYKNHYCSSCGCKVKVKVPKSFVAPKRTQKNKKRLSKMSYNDIIKSKKMSVKKITQTGGEPCEYLKVQGMQLPELQIPDQYAKMYNNCDAVSSTPSPGGMHPNMTT
jgi:hypothetical protein